MERNGEDYICPNCTILQVQDEASSEATDMQDTRSGPLGADSTDFTSIGTVEQKSSEDQGIKGRIEKLQTQVARRNSRYSSP